MAKARYAILATPILCAMAVSASAHPRHHWSRHHAHHRWHHRPIAWRAEHSAHGVSGDPRPAAWCGWFMRHLLGVADRSFNLARNWAHWGHSSSPGPGVVVVWPHHVGIIRSGPDSSGRYEVESGNDGHAVRTRYRSIAGAIAFRS